MYIADLPETWPTTRATLQAYAQALTAFPRAAAVPDPRWSHVSMHPTLGGFDSAPTPLADGTELNSSLDLHLHRIVVTAGEDRLTFDMQDGRSPHELGRAVAALTEAHGSSIDVDEDRFSETANPDYSADDAMAFLKAAHMAVSALAYVNETVEGEVTGPHLWPHGFDIASEWYSATTVEVDGSSVNPQIAMGWYPGEESYVYVNPWPFQDSFAAVELPAGASWHLDGWQGAKLDIPHDGAVEAKEVAQLGLAVHAAAGPPLSI
ncbi:MAG: DUF5996 family protein [Acidimicrobiia bacterium]